MPNSQPNVITTRQAKSQINHFGRSLIVYICIVMFLQYGADLIHEKYPKYFSGFDYDYFHLGISFVLLLVAGIAFSISAKMLKLPLRDYWKKPKIRKPKLFSLTCVGIGISLISLSVSTVFYLFFQSSSSTYSYLGHYNTSSMIIKNIIYFVYVVIFRPIFEEYIFRGVIQRQLGHYGRYFGVLGSAMLYAIAHPGIAEAFSCFFVGWYLSIITLRYHSIRPTIRIHIGIALFLWMLDAVPGNYIWVLSILIVLVYIIAGLSLFQRSVFQTAARTGATEARLWGILLSTPTIIICLLLFIGNVVLSYI